MSVERRLGQGVPAVGATAILQGAGYGADARRRVRGAAAASVCAASMGRR